VLNYRIMTATKPGNVRGAAKPVRVALTPQHVAAFADWLEEIGAVSTAQVIRDIGKQHGHAAAVKTVQQVLQQLSPAIVAEGEA
jgi:hypothetical protein